MALFNTKTDDERAAHAARKAEAAYWASPQGKAEQAFVRGDEFFQVEIPHSSITGFTNAAFNSATKGTIRRNLMRTDLLGQIEETGWHLLHADWVYIQTGQNSRDKFLASGQHVVVTGEVIGIYLFRRDETRVDHATARKTPEQGRAPVPATTSGDHNIVRVKCFKCQHSQDIPVAQRSFVCGQCGERLKRKVVPI